MRILRYKDLDMQGFERKISVLEQHLRQGDFRAADVKKMIATGFYRAKLDKDNRLLFTLADYHSEKVILLLEVIRSHKYDRSRFLNGKSADIDEAAEALLPETLQTSHKMKFLGQEARCFHFLNKPIIFDGEQDSLYRFPFPAIIVGSAGSGKTAISLEKMKALSGRVLYVTLSSYLAENSGDVYYSAGYSNEQQDIDFLSFHDFLESFAVPEGKELSFREFASWYFAQKIKDMDAHELFEEFKGVLTGSEVTKPWLSREDYLNLGIRQSIVPENKRNIVYDLFEKYLRFLNQKGFFDLNILSYNYLGVIEKRYDYLFIDEIQDFTNIQIYLLLQSLKNPEQGNFLFCGDSNQIVHPNFFSWSHLKSLFFKEEITKKTIFNILHKNYRSSKKVAELSNRILLIKNKRFGSVDKESNYLITSAGSGDGQLDLLGMKPASLKKLNQQTSGSTRFAVIVLHDQDKAKARAFFKTPLLFSIREVKGLEYENIILFNMISGERSVFSEIAEGVEKNDLTAVELSYGRAKDKSDKSLEIYKFFINALYVAVSRSTANVFWVESELHHPMVNLLGLEEHSGDLKIVARASSQEEWQREARRLEKQGKDEQVEAIRSQVLKIRPVPWTPLDEKDIEPLAESSYVKREKQSQRKLLAYSVLYHDPLIPVHLGSVGYNVSTSYQSRKDFAISRFNKEWLNEYELMEAVKRYGIDFKNAFGLTPLMGAVLLGRTALVEKFLDAGAKPELTDFAGRTAFDIATCEALFCPGFMNSAYSGMHGLLAPGSVKIRANHKLIRIDRNQMEYTLINLLKVSLWFWLAKRPADKPSFRAQELLELLELFPDHLIPARRKKRPYVSSMLSKNEIYRQDPYNRSLFLRERLGCYYINPGLELWSYGRWISFYSLLGLSRFEATNRDELLRRKLSELQMVRTSWKARELAGMQAGSVQQWKN